MDIPKKAFLRRGEVMAFLGFSKRDMQKAVECGALTPRYPFATDAEKGRGKKRTFRAHYRTVDVLRLAGLLD